MSRYTLRGKVEDLIRDRDIIDADEIREILELDHKPLTKEELAAFREANPHNHLTLAALAAWVNVRPDQLPKEMRAHNCPDTMEAWTRVANAVLKADAH